MTDELRKSQLAEIDRLLVDNTRLAQTLYDKIINYTAENATLANRNRALEDDNKVLLILAEKSDKFKDLLCEAREIVATCEFIGQILNGKDREIHLDDIYQFSNDFNNANDLLTKIDDILKRNTNE